MEQQFDVAVIGAGASGLCAAALLAHRGYRTLLIERLEFIGGRASTRYIDGFAVNTGAMGIELGTEMERVFKEVGAELILRQPAPGIVCRVGQRDLNISSGLPGLIVRTATHLLRFALRALPSLRAKPEQSTAEWVHRFIRNATLLGVVRNFVGSIFATTPQQLPAALFLHYLTEKGAFKKFGFPPGGTIRVWNSLLARYQEKGGELWLEAEVQALHFDADSGAARLDLMRDGQRLEVRTAAVVSDIGPAATLRLCAESSMPKVYADLVAERDQPSAIITVYFASLTPLARFPGFACFSNTQRMSYATSFSPICPENAPSGWYLYACASVPHPCVGDFDEPHEIALLMEDIKEQFPGFENARVLDIVITKGQWPAQRAIAGRDLPHTTPISTLWNIGDAVKPWGNAATSACAEIAWIVADEIASDARIPRSGSKL